MEGVVDFCGSFGCAVWIYSSMPVSLLTRVSISPHAFTCPSSSVLSRLCSKFASMSPEAVRAAILLTLVVQNSAQAIFMRYSFKPKDQV